MLDGDGFASAIVDELEVDLEHGYSITQRTEKARDFFAVLQLFCKVLLYATVNPGGRVGTIHECVFM